MRPSFRPSSASPGSRSPARRPRVRFVVGALAVVGLVGASVAGASHKNSPAIPIAVAFADADADRMPDHLGDTVHLRGVLATPPGAARLNGADVAALVDASGGTVLTDSLHRLAGYGPGDEVAVVGQVSTFNGLEQLVVHRVAKLGGRAVPAPLEVQPAALLDEQLAGRMVRVRGRLVTSERETGRRAFFVESDGARIQLYVPEPIVPGLDVPLALDDGGRAVEVVGVAGQFDRTVPYTEGYQLILLASDAVTVRGIARAELRRWGVIALLAVLLVAAAGYRAHARRLAGLTVTDAMTGLLNRRGFQQIIEPALAEAQVERTPLALVLLDLDDFKHANDRYGHLVGDAVLRAVARELRDQLRPLGGRACRYGGDEFVLVLPGVDARPALALAERLLGALRTVTVAGPDGPLLLRLGVSAGVAALPRGATSTPEALLAAADAALYASKRDGKGQVRPAAALAG